MSLPFHQGDLGSVQVCPQCGAVVPPREAPGGVLKEFCHDLCRARYRSAHRTPEQRERLRRYFRERDRKIRAAKQAQKRKPWTKAQVLAVLQHDPYADWEVVYSEETEGTTTPHTVLTC